MDKHIQQKILQEAGLNTPDSMIVHEKEWRGDRNAVKKKLTSHFKFPFFAKPIREGSSMGVTSIKDEASLEKGIEEALIWDNAVLVEEFIDGIEFSCIVLEEDGKAMPLDLTEIYPQSEYYTYDDKYMPGRCRKFTPPKNIPPDVVKKIKEEVIRAYHALDFRSYGRIDGFLTKDGRILITDPNSSSGMAPSSFFFEQAACAGILPSMVISTLIQNAIRIHQQKHGPL
jgi:D-alanine-D-alanine ligase